MNVLIFVVTLLMMLTLMTYARLDTFRSSQTFQIIFQYYMENDERAYINQQAISLYDAIKVNTAVKGEKGKGEKAEGISRIGIALLINQTKREEKPREWQQTQLLLKNLMVALYGEQPFFQQAIEHNPVLLDELIAAIVSAIDGLPKEQKIKSAKELANLKLADPQLDHILYKILHGSSCKMIQTKQKTAPQLDETELQIDRSVPEAEQQALSNEFQSTQGYCSLLDFVTATGMPKVRIYLAPREILKAIFHDPHVVDEIISERKELYKLATASDADPSELGQQFKEHFDRLKDSALDNESVSYDVSKTNPKDYE